MLKNKKEFSKVLLIQESVLIWIISLSFLLLAFQCIHNGYLGSLPWLAAMVGFPWSAYGVSQVYYYKKSSAENTKDGIKFQTVLTEMEKISSQYQDASALDFNEDLIQDLNELTTDNIDTYTI